MAVQRVGHGFVAGRYPVLDQVIESAAMIQYLLHPVAVGLLVAVFGLTGLSWFVL